MTFKTKQFNITDLHPFLYLQHAKTLCRSESTVGNAEIARNAGAAQKDRETNCGLNVEGS